MLYSHKDCCHLYKFRKSIYTVIMFALLFTVFVTLHSHTGFNISSAMSDLKKTINSFSIIPEPLDLTTVTLS